MKCDGCYYFDGSCCHYWDNQDSWSAHVDLCSILAEDDFDEV